MSMIPGNAAPKIVEIQRPSYTWKRLQNVWTVNPSRMIYLPEQEQADGSVWNSTFIGIVEHEDANGVLTEHKFKLYGPMADNANRELKEKNQIAQIWAEGHVRQESWQDDDGNTHVGHTTRVKAGNMAVIQIKPYVSEHPQPIDAENPFAMAPASPQQPQTSYNDYRDANAPQTPAGPNYELIPGDDDAPF